MPTVAVYGAILAVLFVSLSVRVVTLRNRLRTPVGDAEDATLRRAIRAHGNFAEYVPLALVLLLFAELGGTASAWVHGLGACLLVGRVVHAYGVSQVREVLGFRIAGMALTFTAVLGAAGFVLRAAL